MVHYLEFGDYCRIAGEVLDLDPERGWSAAPPRPPEPERTARRARPAHRLDTPLVLTLDHRHFAAVKPAHRGALRLLPE